jgi:hypothetical protein
MSPQEDSMARFDRIMRALVAVPKQEALKTMKKTLADKRTKRRKRLNRKSPE